MYMNMYEIRLSKLNNWTVIFCICLLCKRCIAVSCIVRIKIDDREYLLKLKFSDTVLRCYAKISQAWNIKNVLSFVLYRNRYNFQYNSKISENNFQLQYTEKIIRFIQHSYCFHKDVMSTTIHNVLCIM